MRGQPPAPALLYAYMCNNLAVPGKPAIVFDLVTEELRFIRLCWLLYLVLFRLLTVIFDKEKENI
jgi:hypothetical protein